MFATEKFENGDLPAAFCDLYKRSEAEINEQSELIREARQKVIQNEEERRQAALAAAAKKKPGKGGNKKDAAEEDKKDDDKPKGPPPKVELDLNKPRDFQEALNERIGRPFIFGPVEFHGLDEPETFNGEEWRKLI